MPENPLDALRWGDACLVPPGPPLSPDQARRVKGLMGYVPEYMSGFSQVPWLLDNTLRFHESPRIHIGYDMGDLISLIISQDSSCRYCYGVSRSLLQITGMPDAKIRELEQNLHSGDLPADRKSALDYARKIARANPRPGATEESTLRQHGWSREAVSEIAFMAAESIFLNRSMTLAAAQPAPLEQITRGWKSLLLQPLVRKMLNKKRSKGNPVYLQETSEDLPYGGIVKIADGLPGVAVFRRMIDGMLASDILPRRSKLMIMAVIARVLQCESCERESVRLLEQEGITKAQSAEILEKLSSPVLTPKEALMVPMARHTVRSQPPEMQSRMLELRGHLEPAEFVEFIGVASLGNALSRLSCLLSRC